MGDFKNFLEESEQALSNIKFVLNDMDEEDIDVFGDYLYNEFFDKDEDYSEDDYYTVDDVLSMTNELGTDMYDYVLDMLGESDEEIEEGVTRRMLATNRNKKKRKFMSNSRSAMRRTKAQRKRDARKNKNARKKYYRANKQKIKAYQKSRREAIKKKKHVVKTRRQSG